MNHQYEVFGSLEADHVFIQYVDDRDLSGIEKEMEEIQLRSGHKDFCILAVKVKEWFSELPPWEAPPVFGKEPFGKGGEKTLKILMEEILPALFPSFFSQSERTQRFYLCGYSLAGLFALWGAYQTPVFSGVVAASPSVWYKDWIDYARHHEIQAGKVYLSLGLKEEKARNKTMAAVGDCIRQMETILKNKAVSCILEWNPGNHFVDSEIRMAKGMAWILKLEEETS